MNKNAIVIGLLLAASALAAHHRLNDDGGAVFNMDTSGGAIVTGPTYPHTVTLRANAAVKIDAAGNTPSLAGDGASWAEVPGGSELNPGADRIFSVVCWVKPTSANANYELLGRGDQAVDNSWALRLQSSQCSGFTTSSVRFFVKANPGATFCVADVCPSPSVAANTWMHIVASLVSRSAECVAGDWIIWVNGQRQSVIISSSGANVNLDLTSTANMMLMARNGGGSTTNLLLNGSIAECQIRIPAITADADALLLYSKGKATHTP